MVMRINKTCELCKQESIYYNSSTKTYKCSQCGVDFFREDVEDDDKGLRRVIVGYDPDGEPIWKTYRA